MADKTPARGAKSQSNVAWPAKIVGWLLGPPTSSGFAHSRHHRFKACSKCANSVGFVGVVASGFLMALKGYLGVVGHSTALIADAVHSGADLLSALMLLIGLKVARRPADARYPYGYGKIEFIIAVVIYLSLIGAGVVIMVDAISAIIHGVHVTPSPVTLLGAAIAVVTNEMMFRQSFCAGRMISSPSLVANAWEKRSDALTSVAVLIGISGSLAGLRCFDPFAAILVGVYILKFSIKMLLEAFKGLLDSSLEQKVVDGIRATAAGVEGVLGIERVRTRELGQQVWIELDVLVEGDARVGEVTRIKKQIRRAVKTEVDRPATIEVFLKPGSDG